MKRMISVTACALLGTLVLSGCSAKSVEEVDSQPTTVPTTVSESIVETQTATTGATEPEAPQSTNIAGTSQNDAAMLPLGTKAFATVDSGAYAWFAFTTGSTPNATYCVTFTNTKPGTGHLYGTLLDEYGTELNYDRASDNGTPATLLAEELKPNTTYYVRLNPTNPEAIDYSVVVKDPNGKVTESKTVGNAPDAAATISQDGAAVGGTSPDSAPLVSLETKVSGTVESNRAVWFAFTTGAAPETTYNVTFVNTKAGSGDLYGSLFDEYGTNLGYERASSNGTPATIGLKEPKPNTTYYVRLNPTNPEALDYTLVVKDPNAGSAGTEQGTSGEQAHLSDNEVVPGSSQDDAVLVPLGTKVFGTVKGGQYAWFSFQTGDKPDATYNVTFINTKSDGNALRGELFDEYGKNLGYDTALNSGVPITLSSNQLLPNTTYYVRLNPINKSNIDYSVVVKDPDSKNTAYKTVGTFTEARGATLTQDGAVVAGTSPNNAVLLPLGTKVSGTVGGKESAWFGFTTGETENETYNVTFINTKSEGNALRGELYNEYGKNLGYDTANSDGNAITISSNQLLPNTTYYIRLWPINNSKVDYSLMVKSPKEEPSVTERAPLVFEVPFEINETQVEFVIDQATFLDEAKAKEVLKPVAEAILQYPDHSILIAGTTATDGTQKECLDLSVKRAEAVKNLLITAYKVPEAQLKIIGLGYEKDPFERGKDIDANGNFVESEGRKNRRVVVLDVDDPIAQELLKSNP